MLALIAAGSAVMSGARGVTSHHLTEEPRLFVPGSDLPVVKTHEYRMAGKIRPLLFWVGQDTVGSARLVWKHADSGAVAYELLIGSDPVVAPRGLNRWGYLVEEVRGWEGQLLGVMSESDEQSLGQVRSRLEHGGSGHTFVAIRSSVVAGVSSAKVWHVQTAQDLTLRDASLAVGLLERGAQEAAVQTRRIPPGVRPGFLAAVADLVHESVRQHRGGAGTPDALKSISVPYVYGDSLHDLTLRSHELLSVYQTDGYTYANVVHGDFETRGRATHRKVHFEMIYGAEGDLAEVPILITYQPRWWLRVELLLKMDSSGTEGS